jgi:ribosomal-protein-alanine N-acetyltransferase
MKNSYCTASIIEEDGAVAGYAFCWVVFEQAHLINIAIAPDHRGRGLGEALMVHVMRQARAQGAEVMHLEVREANEAAVTLYFKYGFTVLGRKDRYYGDGAAALLMQKDLTKP